MIYVLIILVILFAMFIVPLRVKIYYNSGLDGDIYDEKSIKKYSNLKLKTYVLKYIPFIGYKKDSKADDKFEDKKDLNKSHILNFIYSLFMELVGYNKIRKGLLNKDELPQIMDNIYFEESRLNLEIDTKNYLSNCYIITGINTMANIFLARNVDKFNIEGTKWLVGLNKNKNKIYELKFESIISIKLVNTIYIFVKVIYRYIKNKMSKEEK